MVISIFLFLKKVWSRLKFKKFQGGKQISCTGALPEQKR